MNSIDLNTNDNWDVERPLEGDERHPVDADAIDLSTIAADGSQYAQRHRRLAAIVILLFWTIQFAITTVIVLAQQKIVTEFLVPRALVSLTGVAMSFAMVAIHDRLAGSSLAKRAAIAALMAAITAAISVFINCVVFYRLFGFSKLGMPTLFDLADDYLLRLWIFGTLSAIILSIFYASDIREREVRISALQQLAQSAQLRALRNQLQPHFLFNALNSIAALISGKRPGEAEAMTENLADFLRTTLALDPQALITLDEEIRLQQLYLAIEQVRFPGRISIAIDIPDALQATLVPSLITQPLVENSIKYAVARSVATVALTISAQKVGDCVELIVSDDGGNANRAPARGARVGLRNVAERLRSHFGKRGTIKAGAVPGGGFRNQLSIPFAVHA